MEFFGQTSHTSHIILGMYITHSCNEATPWLENKAVNPKHKPFVIIHSQCIISATTLNQKWFATCNTINGLHLYSCISVNEGMQMVSSHFIPWEHLLKTTIDIVRYVTLFHLIPKDWTWQKSFERQNNPTRNWFVVSYSFFPSFWIPYRKSI